MSILFRDPFRELVASAIEHLLTHPILHAHNDGLRLTLHIDVVVVLLTFRLGARDVEVADAILEILDELGGEAPRTIRMSASLVVTGIVAIEHDDILHEVGEVASHPRWIPIKLTIERQHLDGLVLLECHLGVAGPERNVDFVDVSG